MLGGGNLLAERDQIFLTSVLDHTNLGEMLPEFKFVQNNPQICDRNLKISDVGNDGFVEIVELNICRKCLVGKYSIYPIGTIYRSQYYLYI